MTLEHPKKDGFHLRLCRKPGPQHEHLQNSWERPTRRKTEASYQHMSGSHFLSSFIWLLKLTCHCPHSLLGYRYVSFDKQTHTVRKPYQGPDKFHNPQMPSYGPTVANLFPSPPMTGNHDSVFQNGMSHL